MSVFYLPDRLIVDPTHGFVNYLGEDDARRAHLILASDGSPAYISVDAVNRYNASDYYYGEFKQGGRPSVRISSKKTWTHALVISDIAHMPGGTCGTWQLVSSAFARAFPLTFTT